MPKYNNYTGGEKYGNPVDVNPEGIGVLLSLLEIELFLKYFPILSSSRIL